MDTFRNMKAFISLVEAGGFTAAARHLDTTAGYVSRCISELEAHLRTRLVNRTTRRIALTEAGSRYLSRCYDIIASVTNAEAEALSALAKPDGTLKMHSMSSIGQNYVVPAIATYQDLFPDVTVDLTLSQNVPDLLEEGYDVALRVSPASLPDSIYISHKVGTVHSVLCAAPAYIERHGYPSTVEELASHTCLQVAMPIFPADEWTLTGPGGTYSFALPAKRFRVNVPDAMAVALHDGMGIGALPTLTVRSALRSGALVKVLPEYRLQELNIYLLYASRQYLDAKIKTWIEFFRTWITAALEEDDVALEKSTPSDAAKLAGTIATRLPV
ncbi:LysR family transcriptional regulator [Paraburkholderia edwinii]|uniref:LysR family transcriptional regulator n=1 Tax=Paraburkholderia edwinii TaxID=2861782 RepID=A0ABX8USF1_9BURK|nr:LysR family transcriptional regulator [Paraburkholderia edwinii]QYD71943.1 LysR family transcriptional regulator [Paraburkholderia edwinii]